MKFGMPPKLSMKCQFLNLTYFKVGGRRKRKVDEVFKYSF
jgi:hypothetical protein